MKDTTIEQDRRRELIALWRIARAANAFVLSADNQRIKMGAGQQADFAELAKSLEADSDLLDSMEARDEAPPSIQCHTVLCSKLAVETVVVTRITNGEEADRREVCVEHVKQALKEVRKGYRAKLLEGE